MRVHQPGGHLMRARDTKVEDWYSSTHTLLVPVQ